MTAAIETDSESIVHLRVSVARMEGMLTQALTDQGARLTRVEGDVVSIHGRLNEKAKKIATHDERINSNMQRITELEESRDGAQARFLALLAGGVGVLSFIMQLLPENVIK